ncbi:MAG: hypothetical protein Q9201_004888 [Fulgogasparrea decipioides]
MARPVTEVVTIPLQVGADIENPNAVAGRIISDTLNTVTQQEGYQRAYYGRQVENPSILQIYADWDSIDAHKKFTNQSYYGPFAKHLLSVVDGGMEIFHVNFSPHPPAAALSGTTAVTEVVGHYFSTDLSESDKSSFERNLMEFVKVLEQKAAGFTGFAGGWVIEELEHKEVEGKTKVWQSCIGWQSVEAHMAFRETQDFKDNVHLMRPEFKKATTMHHVACKEA